MAHKRRPCGRNALCQKLLHSPGTARGFPGKKMRNVGNTQFLFAYQHFPKNLPEFRPLFRSTPVDRSKTRLPSASLFWPTPLVLRFGGSCKPHQRTYGVSNNGYCITWWTVLLNIKWIIIKVLSSFATTRILGKKRDSDLTQLKLFCISSKIWYLPRRIWRNVCSHLWMIPHRVFIFVETLTDDLMHIFKSGILFYFMLKSIHWKILRFDN